MSGAGRGHRVVEHTADVIIEAWGPDLAACCEAAVEGLAETFVRVIDAGLVAPIVAEVAADDDAGLLLAVLDEYLVTLDTAAGVPVAAHVSKRPDGGLRVEMTLADPASVEQVGSIPKAVSRHEIDVTGERGHVRCRFLVDV